MKKLFIILAVLAIACKKETQCHIEDGKYEAVTLTKNGSTIPYSSIGFRNIAEISNNNVKGYIIQAGDTMNVSYNTVDCSKVFNITSSSFSLGKSSDYTTFSK